MALFSNVHRGSWGGLPDFGITEALTGRRTSQGGSNLIASAGSSRAYSPAPISSSMPQGSVLRNPTQSLSQSPFGPARPQGVGVPAAVGMPAGGSPQGAIVPSYDQGQPQMPSLNFDEMIAPALQALDASIAPAEQGYQSTVGQIEGQRNNRRSQQLESQSAAEARGATQKSADSATTESAIDEARRQFSELQQGLQARYGGTTGTGAFAAEQAGGQTFKNIAGFRQGLSQAIRGIDDKLEEVRGVTQVALADIEDQAQNQKLQAKSQLDQTLNQIRQAKGELQGRKAELASQALQYYQETVRRVGEQNQQFAQQLMLEQTKAENQLSLARQRASSTSFSPYTIQQPNGDFSISNYDSKSGQFSPTGQAGRIVSSSFQPKDTTEVANDFDGDGKPDW